MSSDFKTVQERYSSVIGASNLQDDAHHTQTDILAAVALVGGLGGLLMRVKSGQDAGRLPALMDGWQGHVLDMANRQHWPTCIKPQKVAVEVLKYWLANICPSCTGRKFQRHSSAPTLTVEVCPCCDGAGIKPTNFPPEYRRYALDALADLSAIDVAVGIQVSRKLK